MSVSTSILRQVLSDNRAVRVLAAQGLANTIGTGATATISIVYFNTVVGLSATRIAAAMSIAAVVGLVLSTYLGMVADRRSPVQLLRVALLLMALATLVLPAVRGWAVLVIVLTVLSVLAAATRNTRQLIVARIGAEGARGVQYVAYLRAVSNTGLALGSLLAILPLTLGSDWGFQAVFVLDALSFAIAALLAGQLPQLPVLPPAWTSDNDGEKPGVTPVWKDHPFVAMTVLQSVFSIHYYVQEIAWPLWVITSTDAPDWVIAVMFILNTALVAVGQVRVSRGIFDATTAAAAFPRAGILIAVGFLTLAAATWAGPTSAVALLLAGAVIHVLGEMIGSAAQWGVQLGLAPMERQGEYQGFAGLAVASAGAVAPLVVTWLCIENGFLGWLLISLLIAGSALLTVPVVRWGLRTRAQYGIASHTG